MNSDISIIQQLKNIFYIIEDDNKPFEDKIFSILEKITQQLEFSKGLINISNKQNNEYVQCLYPENNKTRPFVIDDLVSLDRTNKYSNSALNQDVWSTPILNYIICSYSNNEYDIYLLIANKSNEVTVRDLGICELILERILYYYANWKIKNQTENILAKNLLFTTSANEALFFSEKGYCIECNEVAQNMFGYSHTELVGMFGTDVIAPESKELVKNNMLSAYKLPYEALALRKDGSKFWSEITGKIVDYKGRLIRVTSLRDITAQKLAEEKLIASEKKFRLLFSNMNEAFSLHKVILDADSKGLQLIYKDVNPAFEKLFNLNKQDIIDKDLFQVWGNIDATALDNYEQVIRKGEAVEFIYHSIATQQYFEVKAYSPQENYLAQTITDISETQSSALKIKKQNEQLELLVYLSELKVQDSEELIQFILNALVDYTNCISGFCKVYIQSNNAKVILNNTNTTNDYLINLSQNDDFNSIIKEAKKTICIANEEYIEAGVNEVITFPIWRSGNIQLVFVFTSDNTHNTIDVKSVNSLVQNIWPIIERQVYEDQILKEKENAKVFEYRFAEIEKAGKIGWYEARIKEGKFLGSYEAYKIFFDEFSEVPATPEKLSSVIHPDDREHFFNTVQHNVDAKNSDFEWEYRLITPKVGLKYIYSKAFLDFDNKGDLIRRYGIVQDITEKKIYEQQLIKAKEDAIVSDRLKSAFLANMSHEIRTPMNGIIGFSELFSQPNTTKEQQVKYAKIVIESGRQLLSIVDDILDISKIEVGQLKIKIDPVNINLLIQELFSFYSPKALEKNISFFPFKALNDIDATIISDKHRIVQVLNNLLSNAFKFTKKGEISFGYDKKEDTIEFFVKDTGVGIPKNLHDVVFDRFRQSDQDIVKEVGGTGLGLAISTKLSDLLGGNIKFVSEEGVGTTFYFTIPYKPTKEDVSIKERPGKYIQSGKLTILLVEDEAVNCQYIEELLLDKPIVLLQAKDGIEAIEMVKKDLSIDIILMDIKMPRMDGLEATRRIREFNSDIPIIMQTAYAMESDKQNAIKAGCSGFIAKPILADELYQLIEAATK